MTAGQLLARMKKGGLPPALLLLGPEAYQRRRLKEALTASFSEGAITAYDLSQASLAEVLDDARALSLFAAERLIWVVNAEAALPKGRVEDDGDGETAGGSAVPLASYMTDPTPGVTVILEAIRFDFEGDEKRRLDRVRKFYAAIPDVVELRRFAAHEARTEAEALLRHTGVRMDASTLDLLVESLGADMARIAVEMEKLALYAGNRPLGLDELATLVPDARATTVLALVHALGRRDREKSLELLDTLAREGAYLPLVLAFLSTQFRMALVACEAGLKSSAQIQGHFARLGMPVWGSRAEQIQQTVSKFNRSHLKHALELLFEADRGLRDARPDDHIVMERLVLQLTA